MEWDEEQFLANHVEEIAILKAMSFDEYNAYLAGVYNGTVKPLLKPEYCFSRKGYRYNAATGCYDRPIVTTVTNKKKRKTTVPVNPIVETKLSDQSLYPNKL